MNCVTQCNININTTHGIARPNLYIYHTHVTPARLVCDSVDSVDATSTFGGWVNVLCPVRSTAVVRPLVQCFRCGGFSVIPDSVDGNWMEKCGKGHGMVAWMSVIRYVVLYRRVG